MMKNFLKSFQDAMSAAAFAEVGEFESARQFAGKDKNRHKKVLLVLDGREEDFSKALKHSLGLCQRLGGQLEILHLNSEESQGNALDHRVSVDESMEMTIVYSPISGQQTVEAKVDEYLDGRRDILCVVISSSVSKSSTRQKAAVQDFQAWLMKKLSCPVVVLSSCP